VTPRAGVGGPNLEAAVPPEASAAILAWYDSRGRRLPFRGTRDPYAILVSEVMAQQTQIDRVGPAWAAFIEKFPSFDDLAVASPADVLRAWAGLGYNRRALNLWRCARVVVAEHGGRLPSDLDALMALPGIGPYTARAVSAIAYGLAVGAVDTNVRRVLTRIAGVSRSSAQALADAVVPVDRPADWTHAVMDIGATFCRSARPRCDGCPANPWCRYAQEGAAVERAPVTTGRASPRPFRRTSRWLRGRILDRLRTTYGWVEFDEGIGDHDTAAVRASLRIMAAEGLVELDPRADPPESCARLPLG
jgi:A/G-specific adenine glycosylase